MDLEKFTKKAEDYIKARATYIPYRDTIEIEVWNFIKGVSGLIRPFGMDFRNYIYSNDEDIYKFLGLIKLKDYFSSKISETEFSVDIDNKVLYIDVYEEMGSLDYSGSFTFEEIATYEEILNKAFAKWNEKLKADKAKKKEAADTKEAKDAEAALVAYMKFKDKGYYSK